jgi:hypothetical protein
MSLVEYPVGEGDDAFAGDHEDFLHCPHLLRIAGVKFAVRKAGQGTRKVRHRNAMIITQQSNILRRGVVC